MSWSRANRALFIVCVVFLSSLQARVQFTSSTNVPYKASAMVPVYSAGVNAYASLMYLMAKDDPITWTDRQKSEALISILFDKSGSSVVAPLINKHVCINHSVVPESGKDSARRKPTFVMSTNPFFGKQLAHLATMPGGRPVVATAESIGIISSVPSGTFTLPCVTREEGVLFDGLGNSITHISALAASSNVIFAATPQAGSSSVEGHAGDVFQALEINDHGLKQKEKVEVGSVESGINGSRGALDDVSVMHWDNTLKRLFIGLNKPNGGVCVLVGRMASESACKTASYLGYTAVASGFSVQPITQNVPGADWDGNDHIIAQNSDTRHNVVHLKTMHTSTGRVYLIPAVSSGTTTKKVYAVPLVSNVQTEDGVDEKNVGQCAQKASFNLVAKEGKDAQLFASGDAAAIVGGGDAPEAIQDVLVLGDAVFVCCAGTTASTRGVFRSQALFDAEGALLGWTKWVRASASDTQAYGAGLDPDGQLWVHASQATSVPAVTRSSWGTGAGNGVLGGSAGAPHNGLVAHMNTVLLSSPSGMSHFASYGSHNTALSDMSVWVAANSEKIVIVRSGGVLGDFVASSDTYYEHDISAVDTIGDITCSTLSTDKKRIIVGGQNGVMVWRKNSDGSGWSSTQSTIDAASYSFTQVGNFHDVRAVASDGTYAYIMTLHALYRVTLSSAALASTPAASLTTETVATVKTVCGSDDHSFLSINMVGDYLVLATTNGLYTQSGGTASTVADQLNTAAGWRPVYMNQAAGATFGVCSSVLYHAVAGQSVGNLFVLSADVSLNTGTMYRLAVDASDLTASSSIQPVMAYHKGSGVSYSAVTNLEQLSEYIAQDGAFVYSMNSSHYVFDRYGYYKERQAEARPLRVFAPVNAWGGRIETRMPDMAISTDGYVAASLAWDDSGALLVPGSWGLRILQ